jgi:hypothetical protein
MNRCAVNEVRGGIRKTIKTVIIRMQEPSPPNLTTSISASNDRHPRI